MDDTDDGARRTVEMVLVSLFFFISLVLFFFSFLGVLLEYVDWLVEREMARESTEAKKKYLFIDPNGMT